jgi:hypothetical protein
VFREDEGAADGAAIDSETGAPSADPLHHASPLAADGLEGALPTPVRRGDRQIVGEDPAPQGPASHPPTGAELSAAPAVANPPPQGEEDRGALEGDAGSADVAVKARPPP